MSIPLIRAVVFDWRGTLVTELSSRGWAREALRLAGRPCDERAVATLLQSIHTPALLSRLQSPAGNTSFDRHRETYYGVFEAAGLDIELADALWDVDSDPSYNKFAADVTETFDALIASGCVIGVLSNIHFDIRPLFAEAGLYDKVKTFVLSNEREVQKPDPRIFELALGELGTEAAHTLMVGDRPARDGAAAAIGMRVQLIPTLTDPEQRQLHVVTDFVGARSPMVAV